MREIKFRAWTGSEYFTCDSLAGFFTHEENHGEWIVEQFTGLTDKNGVDIYEGDILRSFQEWHNSGGMGQEVERVVGFENGKFTNAYSFRGRFEVVGNIHEVKT